MQDPHPPIGELTDCLSVMLVTRFEFVNFRVAVIIQSPLTLAYSESMNFVTTGHRDQRLAAVVGAARSHPERPV